MATWNGTVFSDRIYVERMFWEYWDTVYANDGNDTVIGGRRNDNLNGENGNDFLYGGGGDDSLTGGAGNDYLDGGQGNDYLDGGVGSDSMSGRVGNDIYVVDSAGDSITEAADNGTDTVVSYISYTLGDNLENLTLTGTDFIIGTGNSLNNVIRGNDAINALFGKAGDDSLYGNGGDDILDGGTGNDYMEGGVGGDIYYVDSAGDIVVEAVNSGTDSVFSSISYSLGDNLENLALTGTSNINGTGNSLNNRLFGNSANNILSGGFGDDSLDGGAGNDILDGGVGEDTLLGGDGNDLLIDTIGTVDGGAGIDTLVADYSQFNNGAGVDVGFNGYNVVLSRLRIDDRFGGAIAPFLSYSNIEQFNITGTQYADVLRGGAGYDTLNGSDGDDLLIDTDGSVDGGAGIDTLVADYSQFNNGAGVDVGFNGANAILSRLDGSTLLSYSSIEQFNLTGTQYADVLRGGAGNDSLNGRAGNDILNGYGGNFGERDELTGGAGADTFVLGDSSFVFYLGLNLNDSLAERDELTGGTGTDSLVLGDFSTAFYIDSRLSDRASILDFNLAEGDTIQLHGSASDYTFTVGSYSLGTDAADTALYYNNDLIAVIQDVSNLSLTSSAFTYVAFTDV